jgi:hypothetical protein
MDYVVVISGSRNILLPHLRIIEDMLNDIIRNYIIHKVIVGDAIGVDKYCTEYLLQKSYDVQTIKADWDKGKHAGMLRNVKMMNMALLERKPIIFVAFWHNSSKGTQHMINLMKNKATINIIKEL